MEVIDPNALAHISVQLKQVLQLVQVSGDLRVKTRGCLKFQALERVWAHSPAHVARLAKSARNQQLRNYADRARAKQMAS